MFLAKVVDVRTDGLEDPQSEQSEQAHECEVEPLPDCLAVVSIASNCWCVSPSVGDSGGTVGRRTYSGGECSRTQ